ncbi:TetR/AcrR family transcriptional regulator [Thermomonospora cellulosilytica]|uniref:AcrR family transcriptional regulator n=1 Tax=Thermomonospora cellulosilytica TaxID=1411118 RepID=A0A7W3N4W1_9ACTN|nr:TetR/AcrR family transcriptional regulator [Thermomonospora cellulosilytica]MBA9007609.1 AcrR family transcriptional regulator [Thermomonospora cellulosilytica]
MPTSTWFRLNVAKRDRVLEAAMREFGEHGYSTGSLNNIAREAGIAKGSLFQYFTDKLEFFAYVCDETSRRIREDMERRIAGIDLDQPFDEWLFDVFCEWTEYMADHPLERGVTAATNFELNNEVRAVVRDTANQHYLQVIHPVLELWRDRGGIRPDADLQILATLIMMTLPFLALAPYYDGLDPMLDLRGKDPAGQRPIIRQLIAGIKPLFAPPDKE